MTKIQNNKILNLIKQYKNKYQKQLLKTQRILILLSVIFLFLISFFIYKIKTFSYKYQTISYKTQQLKNFIKNTSQTWFIKIRNNFLENDTQKNKDYFEKWSLYTIAWYYYWLQNQINDIKKWFIYASSWTDYLDSAVLLYPKKQKKIAQDLKTSIKVYYAIWIKLCFLSYPKAINLAENISKFLEKYEKLLKQKTIILAKIYTQTDDTKYKNCIKQLIEKNSEKYWQIHQFKIQFQKTKKQLEKTFNQIKIYPELCLNKQNLVLPDWFSWNLPQNFIQDYQKTKLSISQLKKSDAKQICQWTQSQQNKQDSNKQNQQKNAWSDKNSQWKNDNKNNWQQNKNLEQQLQELLNNMYKMNKDKIWNTNTKQNQQWQNEQHNNYNNFDNQFNDLQKRMMEKIKQNWEQRYQKIQNLNKNFNYSSKKEVESLFQKFNWYFKDFILKEQSKQKIPEK